MQRSSLWKLSPDNVQQRMVQKIAMWDYRILLSTDNYSAKTHAHTNPHLLFTTTSISFSATISKVSSIGGSTHGCVFGALNHKLFKRNQRTSPLETISVDPLWQEPRLPLGQRLSAEPFRMRTALSSPCKGTCATRNRKLFLHLDRPEFRTSIHHSRHLC